VKSLRVPLAVDAQVRVPLGPAMLPLRTVFALALVTPLGLCLLGLTPVAVTYRVGLVLAAFMLAFTLATPTREGVWIGTWCVYRFAGSVLPTAVISGQPARARVRTVAGAVHVTKVRSDLASRRRYHLLAGVLSVPTAASIAPGLIRLSPGGARAVLILEGPTAPTSSERYSQWCTSVVRWLLSVECPAQLVTVIDHFDSHLAQQAFDRRVEGWPRTPLLELERSLAGAVAEQSLRLRHHVVLSPGIAGADGIPALSRLSGILRAVSAHDDDASRALHSAVRLAGSVGLSVSVPDRDDIGQLLKATVLGASAAAAGSDGTLQIGDHHHAAVVATRLAPVVHPGVIVEALMRVRARGVASLHVLPVDPAVARRALDRRASMHRYVAREGNDAIDNQVALADTARVLAAIAEREIRPVRIALTVALSDPSCERLSSAVERLQGLLGGQGFITTRVSSPGLLPALAVSPGWVPLGRSIQLTSDDVAACLLPALGTPFADHRQPLAGISATTGAPVYLSLWTRFNHNAVVVGTSGAGKSVATKTLLTRHVMNGASAVVIDPDSEYRRVMNALDGRHFELGEDSLNALAAGIEASPDVAAGLVLPVLSVMAGDEKGVRDGRPIRRLPDEDQGWLHGEIAAFFRAWRTRVAADEPVMHDLVGYLETVSIRRALTLREAERCRIVIARLRRFTQGDRASVFDRASTFRVGARPLAIGLRAFAMSYAADLTPALAVVLTGVLASLARSHGRMIIVVDEAHRVTSDPDAGQVLGQLVRQARKHGAGVWMCSQRVEDFVGTDLGKTLAATASTKLVLGAEEASLGDLRDVFSLTEEEISTINPPHQGRGVLISAGERAIVSILPGNAILALADTTPVFGASHAGAAAS